MANPNKWDSQLADATGNAMIGAQQANIADHAAPTAYTPHATGAVAVLSEAATDLDTTAAALDTLVDEVATIVTKVNAILDVLEAHGLMADA
jgi:hypothetical protein